MSCVRVSFIHCLCLELRMRHGHIHLSSTPFPSNGPWMKREKMESLSSKHALILWYLLLICCSCDGESSLCSETMLYLLKQKL